VVGVAFLGYLIALLYQTHHTGKRIDDLRSEINARFASFEKLIDERFANFEKLINERFAAVEKRFDERLAAVEKRFDERFAAVEKRFDDLTRWLQSEIRRLDDRVEKLEHPVVKA
jgi:uncharacterized membrane-anchored protein YjiN (DUF445 family)